MNLSQGKKTKSRGAQYLRVGTDTLPALPKHNTDRNRTSPFAFTGNKFEFRMVPSSASISGSNIVLNTIVAEALDGLAGRLERAKDINKEAQAFVKDIVKKHGKVIFDGNNYSEEWVKEAKKRKLPNIKATPEALEAMAGPVAVKLFEKYKVCSKRELHSRHHIYTEHYAKQINIEAMTAIDMVQKQYMPTVIAYSADLAEAIQRLENVRTDSSVLRNLLEKISGHLRSAEKKLGTLKERTSKAQPMANVFKQAFFYRENVLPAIDDLRKDIDALEMIFPKEKWPAPPKL